jgi:hypothetical protein
MVVKRIIQNIMLFSFLSIGCESQKNILCDNDLKVDNVYSIIDTTKAYSTFYISDTTNIKSNEYLRFKNNGKIIYYSKTTYNDSIVKISQRYLRGEYYMKDKWLILREFFTHPQGGGWIKSIIGYKKNDVLYIRNIKDCKNKRMLDEIKLEDRNKFTSW